MRIKIEMKYHTHREGLVNALANSGYLVRSVDEVSKHCGFDRQYFVEVELPDECLIKEDNKYE